MCLDNSCELEASVFYSPLSDFGPAHESGWLPYADTSGGGLEPLEKRNGLAQLPHQAATWLQLGLRVKDGVLQ